MTKQKTSKTGKTTKPITDKDLDQVAGGGFGSTYSGGTTVNSGGPRNSTGG